MQMLQNYQVDIAAVTPTCSVSGGLCIAALSFITEMSAIKMVIKDLSEDIRMQ